MRTKTAPQRRAPIAFLIVALALAAAATGWLGWTAYRSCRSSKAAAAWALRLEGLGADSPPAPVSLGMAALTLPLLIAAWLVVRHATRTGQAAPVAAALATDVTERRRADEAIRASESHFRSLIENIQFGITIINADCTIVMTNAAQARMFGKKPEDLVGQKCYQAFEKRDSVCPHCPGSTAMATGLPHGVDTGGVRDDGSRLDVRIKAFPLRDATGEIGSFIEVVEDVTERRRAERALADSEAKFRTLFERTSDAVMLLDEQAFFDCNDATLTVFGCSSREEFLQRHPADLSPPTQPSGQDSLSAANERIATALATGTASFEWTHRRVDGTDFPAEVLLNSLELGGRKVLQAVVRDISDRKRAEEQVAKTLAELELFNRLAVGRELRMIELKREVNDMAGAAGLHPPYDLSSLEPCTVPNTTQNPVGDSPPALALAQEVRL